MTKQYIKEMLPELVAAVVGFTIIGVLAYIQSIGGR